MVLNWIINTIWYIPDIQTTVKQKMHSGTSIGNYFAVYRFARISKSYCCFDKFGWIILINYQWSVIPLFQHHNSYRHKSIIGF